MCISLSTVVLNSRDRQENVWLLQKHTWINSSVIVSAKKTGNTSTGTILSKLKIYSRYPIRIIKVKYTQFKVSYILYNSFVCLTACQPPSLPSVRPSSMLF